MNRAGYLVVVALLGCRNDGTEDPERSKALQRARTELAEAKTELADAKAKLKEYSALVKSLRGRTTAEDGTEVPGLPPPGDSIACDSREHCTIDRPYFDLLYASPLGLLEQVTLVPWQQDGEMRGLKLFRIDEGSIPAALGLLGGDVVVAVSDNPLTSLNDVFTVGGKIYASSRYTLSMERKQDAFTLVVEIVSPPSP